MAMYRKKPVVIEAEQWFPDSAELEDVDSSGAAQTVHELRSDQAWIETLEGGHVVSPGDWIITGVQGEKYPCKPDIFEITYEPVADGA